MKNFNKILIAIIGVVVIGGAVWFLSIKPSAPESEIISKKGIHWHADLSIKILGQLQDIPAGIGLGITEHYIHTHESDGIIHIEFPGLVRRDDIRLGQFFEIWGKKFNKECIFDKCNGLDGKLKMLVNGNENSDFENYVMRDKDKIEIIFELDKAGDSVVEEITVVGNDFSFSPSQITVKSGKRVKIIFENKGNVSHNLVIEGLGVTTKTIGSGQKDVVEFTASIQGKFDIICSVPGHKEAGMEGSLIVE
ncbi:MAG: cupredoxin domain-containing protein [bacterium]|nr:cupredoxin domain-containing protein [bacterium]